MMTGSHKSSTDDIEVVDDTYFPSKKDEQVVWVREIRAFLPWSQKKQSGVLRTRTLPYPT